VHLGSAATETRNCPASQKIDGEKKSKKAKAHRIVGGGRKEEDEHRDAPESAYETLETGKEEVRATVGGGGGPLGSGPDVEKKVVKI